ncbi:MAG: Uma2 family endonuclease, partial [Bacteroidota bacterium]
MMTATIAKSPIELVVQDKPVMFKSHWTKEQFHRFVLEHQEFKIERDKYGVITIHPPMSFDSGFLEGEAFGILRDWSKTNSLGRAFSPTTSFDLPDGSEHKADGAWISWEKINQLSPRERKHIAAIVPDFVIEVRSESDSLTKLKEKMEDVWLANGVRLAWLIDPKTEMAWIYRQ